MRKKESRLPGVEAASGKELKQLVDTQDYNTIEGFPPIRWSERELKKAIKKVASRKENSSWSRSIRVGARKIQKGSLLACIDTFAGDPTKGEVQFRESAIKELMEELSFAGCHINSSGLEVYRREDIGVTEDQIRRAALDACKNKLIHSLRLGRKRLFGCNGLSKTYSSSLANRRILAEEIDEVLTLCDGAPATLERLKLLTLVDTQVAVAEGFLSHLFMEAGFPPVQPPRQQIIPVRRSTSTTRQRTPRSHHRVAVSVRGGDSGDDDSGESDPPAPPLSRYGCPYLSVTCNPQPITIVSVDLISRVPMADGHFAWTFGGV